MTPSPVPPNSTPEKSDAPAVRFDDIHVMPDRFLSPDARHNGGKKNTTIIIVLAATLIVGGGAAAAAYVLLKPAPNANENANVNAQQNLNLAPSNLNAVSNLNANASANANLSNQSNANRANTNAGSNLNTNASANGNANLANNANANAGNTNATNTNSAVERTTPLPSALDTDRDGLTDIEEAIYGTDQSKPDSDGDSFVDGKKAGANNGYVGEVYLGYNPNGVGGIETSGFVRLYENASFSYSAFYPTAWLVQPTDRTNRSVLFTPADPTGETFEIAVEENPTGLSAQEYYLARHPGTAALLERVVVNGVEGIRNPNREEVYLEKSGKIYALTYHTGQLASVNFMTTFEMFFQHFRLTAGTP